MTRRLLVDTDVLIDQQARLATLKEKHFPMLSDVHVPYRKLQGR